MYQAGGFPEPEIIHYNPKEFDFGKSKAFPFRDQVMWMPKAQVPNYFPYTGELFFTAISVY